MRRKIGNVISVLHSAIRFAFLKIRHGNKLIVGRVERFSPNVVVEINKGAEVRFGNKVRVHSGSKIKVRNKACLNIASGVKINYNCIIGCRKRIDIGEGTEFGPSVYLYDHDHDFRVGLKNSKFKQEDIIIGKNCWIGAQTVILRGTELGDNCVVGAGCIVKGKYPSNSVIVQKRETTVRSFEVEDARER